MRIRRWLFLLALPLGMEANGGREAHVLDSSRTRHFLAQFLHEEKRAHLAASPELFPGFPKHWIPTGILVDIAGEPPVDPPDPAFPRLAPMGLSEILAYSRFFHRCSINQGALPPAEPAIRFADSLMNRFQGEGILPIVILDVAFNRLTPAFWRNPLQKNRTEPPASSDRFFRVGTVESLGDVSSVKLVFSGNLTISNSRPISRVAITYRDAKKILEVPGEFEIADFDASRLILLDFEAGDGESIQTYLEVNR